MIDVLQTRCESALLMMNDIWNSLDSARNSFEFESVLNVCAAIIHVLSVAPQRSRRIPVAADMINQMAAFVMPLTQDMTLPEDIQSNFITIRDVIYNCCGYTKVKYNGC